MVVTTLGVVGEEGTLVVTGLGRVETGGTVVEGAAGTVVDTESEGGAEVATVPEEASATAGSG